MLVPQANTKNWFATPCREERLFHNLPLHVVQQLSAITSESSYPEGTILFVTGQTPHGLFIVSKGRVKLSVSGASDMALISRVSDAGEVLGLAETLSNKPYLTTAQALEPTQANLIGRRDFLLFLREHAEVALRAAEQLSEDYRVVLSERWDIGLNHLLGGRLTRFLVDLCAGHQEEGGEVRVNLPLTHEEIAQRIGVPRETVTRLLADFEEKQIIEIKGSTLLIRNRNALESLAGEPECSPEQYPFLMTKR